MSEYKPLADRAKIAYLDWDLICQVHVHGYPKGGDQGYEIEPPCESKATLFVTYHTVSTCRLVQQFMCARHFSDLFSNLPETHKSCPVCGETRFRSAKPIYP